MASHASKNLVVHLAITNIKILGSDSFLKCFLFVDNNKMGLLIVLLRLVNSIHTPNLFSIYHHFLINFREKLFIKKLNINYRPFCPVFEYRCVLFGPQKQRNSGKYNPDIIYHINNILFLIFNNKLFKFVENLNFFFYQIISLF